jgi:hypothetical protein
MQAQVIRLGREHENDDWIDWYHMKEQTRYEKNRVRLNVNDVS